MRKQQHRVRSEDQRIIPQGWNDPGHNHSTIEDYGGRGHNEGEPGFPRSVGAKRVNRGFVQEATNRIICYHQCRVCTCRKYHLPDFLFFCFALEMPRNSVSSKEHKSGSAALAHQILAVSSEFHTRLINVYKSSISDFYSITIRSSNNRFFCQRPNF
jgi:hypothetical protein